MLPTEAMQHAYFAQIRAGPNGPGPRLASGGGRFVRNATRAEGLGARRRLVSEWFGGRVWFQNGFDFRTVLISEWFGFSMVSEWFGFRRT